MTWVISFIFIFITVLLLFMNGTAHIKYALRVKKFYNIPFFSTLLKSFFIDSTFINIDFNEAKKMNVGELDQELIRYLNDDSNNNINRYYGEVSITVYVHLSSTNSTSLLEFQFSKSEYYHAKCNSNKIIIPVRTAVLLSKCFKAFDERERIKDSSILTKKK